jgi:hypothetical protein
MTRYHITLLIVIFIQHAGYARLSAKPRAESNDLSTFPNRLLSDANETFTRPNNLTALLLAGGASIAMHNLVKRF